MNKFLLLSSAAVLSFALYAPANADTKLIYNKDTGANVGLSADNKIIGETTVKTKNRTTSTTNIMAENDADSDEASTDASGGILVKHDTETKVETESYETGDDAEAEIKAEVAEARAESDAGIDAARGDVDHRIQQIGENEAGVQATATTKIDLR